MSERTRTSLVAIAVLVGLSLAPAVLLYLLFGALSSADVSWAKGTVKLGGPVAAFFATLLLVTEFHLRSLAARRGSADLTEAYAGRWHIASVSRQNRRTATSDIEAEVNAEGELCFAGNFLDGKGKPIGEWRTLNVFCTPEGLAFRYTLTDAASATAETWVGFATLYVKERDKARRPTRLEGRWDVIGRDHHDGTISFARRAG